MRRSFAGIAASAFCLLSAQACLPREAAAQPAPTVRVRGTIAAVTADDITVTTREGPSVVVKLAPQAAVAVVKKVELSTIAAGSYIGTAVEPGPDGVLQALEVLVFPEAARGSGEGQFAWDLTPKSQMVNATVSTTVDAVSGRDLELTFKGQKVTVRVPPNVPVVTVVPGERADLKAGAGVLIFGATKNADGTLGATRVTVGKDGVAPPM